MLGIFTIICLISYILVRLKLNRLMNQGIDQKIELGHASHRYEVCQQATPLIIACQIIILVGWLGCFWPFWFIEELEKNAFIGLAILGIAPVIAISFAIYLTLRYSNGYLIISKDKIEYSKRKHFSVKISSIKKISYLANGIYKIYLKEKGAKSFLVYTNRLMHRDEICSLMKQLEKHVKTENNRNKSFANKLIACSIKMFFKLITLYLIPFGLTILCKIYFYLVPKLVVLLLIYTSWCCIEYDFFRKDHTKAYNALGAIESPQENAWDYYIKASSEYSELERNLQIIVNEQIEKGRLDLDEQQTLKLKEWYLNNTSALKNLKKAASIDYCNQYFANIPTYSELIDKNSPPEFHVSLSSIKNFYNNLKACRLLSISQLHWTELFQMQLISSKHFIEGKSLIDHLVGYSLLHKTIKLITTENNLSITDLEKARKLLQNNFPGGICPLAIEGEILTAYASYEEYFTQKIKIPSQTPLNPMLLVFGPVNRAHIYIYKDFTDKLEKAYNGIEPYYKGFSELITLPLAVGVYCEIVWPDMVTVNLLTLQADSYISAAYVAIDLEKYKLKNGDYPESIPQMELTGLFSQLPDDPHSDSKIIYLLDENRAILYSVGPGGDDDGGLKGKGSKRNLDDVIYWKRKLDSKND